MIEVPDITSKINKKLQKNHFHVRAAKKQKIKFYISSILKDCVCKMEIAGRFVQCLIG